MPVITQVNEYTRQLDRPARYLPRQFDSYYYGQPDNRINHIKRPSGSYIENNIDEAFAGGAQFDFTVDNEVPYLDGVYPLLNPLGISMDISYLRSISSNGNTSYLYDAATNTIELSLSSSQYPDPNLIQAGDIFITANSRSGGSGNSIASCGIPIKSVTKTATQLLIELDIIDPSYFGDSAFAARVWKIVLMRNGLTIPLELNYFNGDQKIADAAPLEVIYSSPIPNNWVMKWKSKLLVKSILAQENPPIASLYQIAIYYQLLRIDISEPLKRFMITRGQQDSNKLLNGNNSESTGFYTFGIEGSSPNIYSIFNAHNYPITPRILPQPETTISYFAQDPLLLIYGFLKGFSEKDVNEEYVFERDLLFYDSELWGNVELPISTKGGGLVCATYAKDFSLFKARVNNYDYQGDIVSITSQTLIERQNVKKIAIGDFITYAPDGGNLTQPFNPMWFDDYALQYSSQYIANGRLLDNDGANFNFFVYDAKDAGGYVFNGYIRLSGTFAPDIADNTFANAIKQEVNSNSICLYWLNHYGVWQDLIIYGDYQLIRNYSEPTLFTSKRPNQVVNTQVYYFNGEVNFLNGRQSELIGGASGRPQRRVVKVMGSLLDNRFEAVLNDLLSVPIVWVDLDINNTLPEGEPWLAMGSNVYQYNQMKFRHRPYAMQEVELVTNRSTSSFVPEFELLSLDLIAEQTR